MRIFNAFVSLAGLVAYAHGRLVVTYDSTQGRRLGNEAPIDTGLCDSSVKQLAGFIELDDNSNRSYFFWFFESRNKPSTDPVTLWLNGGPGCSSSLGLFTENGPCSIVSENTTKRNEYSWNTKSSLLYVDQPGQTGFSRAGNPSTYSGSELGKDMVKFLEHFMSEYPAYNKGQKFYIFGESYAGHYVPAVSTALLEHINHTAEDNPVQLRLDGISIGNGLTTPSIQYKSYPDVALDFNLVNETVYSQMKNHLPECLRLTDNCNNNPDKIKECSNSTQFCQSVVFGHINRAINPYDIRKKGTYDFSDLTNFMNKVAGPALNINTTSRPWADCNNDVYGSLAGDWALNYNGSVAKVLEAGISVLIYAGDKDYLCNWVGNLAWTKALTWSGNAEFNKNRSLQPWKPTPSKPAAGEFTHGKGKNGKGQLSFLKIFNAGHMVPMDQPEYAREMFNTFIF